MAKIYRVHPEQRSVVVRHPESGAHIVPNPADTYGADHALVREYPWLFTTDDEASEPQPPVETVALNPVTQTVRRGPGRPRKNP